MDPHSHGITYIIYISISLSMVIFIMKYEITDKGPKLLTKIINITENSRKGLAPL